MLEEITRFDMHKKPQRQKLRPLIWALTLPSLFFSGQKLKKVNMKGIKPPYLLLCNHNAFGDFAVATKAVFPHRANYVVAIDGFIGREGLLRAVGGICKRKFTSDVLLVKQLMRVIKNRDIAVIYPEARYSLCGTTAVLPPSIGKLIKLLKVAVVTLVCNGHHVNSPFWNLHKRGIRGQTATMTCIATEQQVEELSSEELFEKVKDAFYYDDFKWQKENGKRVKYAGRAEGLHKVLYQCPHCGTEYRMASKGAEIFCEKCGKRWEMSELGELSAKDGNTEFSHVPDWYEWERANVKKEIEDGTYRFDGAVRVDSLPNAKGYIDLGAGRLVHDRDGFRLTGNYGGKDYTVELPAKAHYSVHIEYEYLGKFGDCVDLNTLNDTFYVYPQGKDFSVTKMSLATEEAFFYHKRIQEEEDGKKASAPIKEEVK